MSLIAASKKGDYASRTSCPPSTTARLKAPGEDVLLLCGPLVAGEGSVKPVARSPRTGPLTARKGKPSGGLRRLPSADGRSEPPAASGAVHTSKQVRGVPTGCRVGAAGLWSRSRSLIWVTVSQRLGRRHVRRVCWSLSISPRMSRSTRASMA